MWWTKKKQKTHNYTKARRRWGHDYVIASIENEGLILNAMGWGHGLRPGDYILMDNAKDSTRYKIQEVSYMADPKDMWEATLTFAARRPRK